MSALTFGQIKQRVTARAGDACAESDDVDLFMLNVLQDMRNTLGNAEVEARADIAITALTQTYAIPVAVSVVREAWDAYGLRLAEDQPERSGMSTDIPTGRPMSWEARAGFITFYPTPSEDTIIQVRGLPALDDTLYTTVNDVRVWNTVPLPREVHTMYFKWVLGMSMLDVDPARGSMWINLAEQEFQRWVKYQTTSNSPLMYNGKGLDQLRNTRRRSLTDVSRFHLDPP